MLTFSDDLRGFLNQAADRSNIAAILTRIPIRAGFEGNYFKEAADGKLSYLPASKSAGYDGFSATGRMRGKPARIVRKALPPALQDVLLDEDFETFANLYKAWHERRYNLTFVHVSGGEIAEKYRALWVNTDVNTGTLEDSCMAGRRSDFFDVYVELDCVELVLAYSGEDSERHIGRALVWTFDGERYMDRPYGADSTREALRAYGREQGMHLRVGEGYDGGDEFEAPDGAVHKPILTVHLPRMFAFWPYMDTLKYLNLHEGYLTNDDSQIGEEGWAELVMTHGGWEGHLEMRCPDCDRTLDTFHEYYPQDGSHRRALRDYFAGEARCLTCRIERRAYELTAPSLIAS